MKIKDNSKNIIKNSLKVLFISLTATILSIILQRSGIGKDNAIMVFLVGVLIVSTTTSGYIYGSISAVLSVMLINYFLTDPIRSFAIHDTQDLILILFFLIASLITGTITSKLRYQTIVATRNERTANLLYDLTKGFLLVTGKDNIVNRGIKYINEYIGYDCYVKLDSEDKIYSSPNLADYKDICKDDLYRIPIKGLSNQIGTLEIFNKKDLINPENEMLIKAIAYQMASVLDREFIYNEREKIRVSMESEHLKSTLLRSISHDLKTPLTGIKGASELIVEGYDKLDNLEMKKLAMDINEEASWLINTVQNILDMTRISEGKLTLNRDYEAVDDIINQAITHVKQLILPNRLHVTYPDDIVLLNVDGRLIVQVLVNLLDNAYKHSKENSPIYLRAYRMDKKVVFEVIDEGEGIDSDVIENMFEGFTTKTKNAADSRVGVGLGLSICKAIVTAHNGSISGENRNSGGAIFRVDLPVSLEE
ncbi:DUF4118 domain-containing protein [Tissierella creatinini]|nr:DUF4118 domain-containing protein [Tissierella creatinini]TJX59968.1 DUF4118 domain-containing protein [Soehngenia saccharolytica]